MILGAGNLSPTINRIPGQGASVEELIPTFVQGLDDALGGGIPKGHTVLVAGAPGTMKTTLLYHMMYHNAKQGVRSLYVSLEESYQDIRSAMEKLGYVGVNEAELYILDIGRMRLEIGQMEKEKDWMEIIQRIIREGVESCNYQIITVDSLEALYALGGLREPRRDLFHFFGFFKDMGTTTFFISEVPFGQNNLSRFGEDFLADGILFLKHFELRETDVQLRLRIVKMRRMRHDQGYFALNYGGGKFFVTKAILE